MTRAVQLGCLRTTTYLYKALEYDATDSTHSLKWSHSGLGRYSPTHPTTIINKPNRHRPKTPPPPRSKKHSQPSPQKRQRQTRSSTSSANKRVASRPCGRCTRCLSTCCIRLLMYWCWDGRIGGIGNGGLCWVVLLCLFDVA